MKFLIKQFPGTKGGLAMIPSNRFEAPFRRKVRVPLLVRSPRVEPWLREWMKQHWVPVRESPDPKTQWLIAEAIQGETVEFRYWRGSTPGARRKFTPGLVFQLGGSGPLYVAGYCHLRSKERVFRLDTMYFELKDA